MCLLYLCSYIWDKKDWRRQETRSNGGESLEVEEYDKNSVYVTRAILVNLVFPTENLVFGFRSVSSLYREKMFLFDWCIALMHPFSLRNLWMSAYVRTTRSFHTSLPRVFSAVRVSLLPFRHAKLPVVMFAREGETKKQVQVLPGCIVNIIRVYERL